MKRLTLILALLAGPAFADDPIVAQRGTDHITLSQARTLLGAMDADSRRKVSATPALTEFLRNVLLQRAVAAQLQLEKWDQRPDVVALGQRARDIAVAQSYLSAQAAVPPGYPSDAEIQAAYDQNKPRFMQPRSYHLAQAVLPVTPATLEATRRHAADLRSQALRGHAGLEDAAKRSPGAQYSDLGWLPENQLVPEVKSTVTGMQEGALSDPVCGGNFCHVLRLIATRPAGPAPLPEVRDALVRAMKQQKEQDGERAYVNALLTKQSVQVNEIQLTHLTGK